MQLIEVIHPQTAVNLAVDEWLLESRDQSNEPGEILRLWENPELAVIAGRGSRIGDEVNESACRARGVEIFRRSSGGTSVVIGPGCLLYSLVLDYRIRPEMKELKMAHEVVLGLIADAILASGGVTVRFEGVCDLILDGRKVSGNAVRCRRNCMLYHGTVLYDFPLALIHECLGTPVRQPDYRAGRSHKEFVTNLPVDAGNLRQAIAAAWKSERDDDVETSPCIDWTAVESLARAKYLNDSWTRRH